MKPDYRRIVAAFAGAAFIAYGSGNTMAQQKSLREDLIGGWTLVSVMTADGKKRVEPYGPAPKGYMTILPNGRFSIQTFRPGTPRFAANDRTKGTAEENRAVVHNSVSYFGTYNVDEAKRTMSIHIEQSTYPNYDGEDQKRFLDLNGDKLTFTNPTATTGGTLTVVWKRATPRQ